MPGEIIKRKGGPIKAQTKMNIIEDLKKIIENGNILGVTHEQLRLKIQSDHKINIKVHTISKYLKEVYNSISPEEIKTTQIKLQTMFDKVFRLVQEMIATAKSTKEKKESIDLLLRAMDKFTMYLESFGLKPKATDHLNINGELKHDNKMEVIIVSRSFEEQEEIEKKEKVIDING